MTQNRTLQSTFRLAFSSAALVACAVAALPGSIQARDSAPPSHPGEIVYPEQTFHPPKPERYEAPNGMVVYYLSDPTIPLVRAYARVRSGSLHEAPEEEGLASLTATLLRLGGSRTTPADEMNENLEAVGAALESAGSRDYSGASLRILSKDKDLGFEYLAQILREPAFPEDKLAQRKGEVAEKLRRQWDDPMEITRNEFRRLVYGEHPYGRNPDGTEASLETFDRSSLVAWHEKTFHPNRIILSVSGDFEPDWLKETVERLFGDWPKFEGEIDEPPSPESDPEPRVVFHPKDLNQSTIRFGHLGVRKGNPDAIPIDVLNFIIGGGGFSSRLVNEVRTKGGYAYLVGSIFDEPLQRGQFVCVLQTQTKNTLAAARLAQETIASALEPGSLTDAEIELAKESKLNDFVFNFETPHAVVQAYAELEFYGMPGDYLETYREKLAKVTRDDLEAVGKKYIDPKKMTFLCLGNPEVAPLLEEAGVEFETLDPPVAAGSTEP